MFIDTFGRAVVKYSGFLIWPLELAGLIAILIRPRLTSHHRYVLVVSYALPLLVVGVVCLTRPRKVQQYILASHAKSSHLSSWRLFPRFVRSSGYVPSLQLVGLLAFGMVALIAYAILK